MKLKKFISGFLALVMLAALMPAASASSAGLQLELKTPSGAKVGDTITVELWCKGNPGITAAQFTLAYSSQVLECLDCETGRALRGMVSVENPTGEKGAIVAAASASVVKGDGLLATYTFKVLKSGSCGFALVDTEFSDGKGNLLRYTVSGLSASIGGTPSGGGSSDIVVSYPVFSDIGGHWAESYLIEGSKRGILQGSPAGTCLPDWDVTRGQFITFLWRSVGEPTPSRKTSFTDMDPRHTYYHDAVAWAEQEGYILGNGRGQFLPEAPITRESVALILWRVAGGKSGGELMFSGIYDNYFTDSGKLSSWAKSGVYWALYNEVWCGKGSLDTGDTLYGGQNASRGEIVVMMVRYQDIFER